MSRRAVMLAAVLLAAPCAAPQSDTPQPGSSSRQPSPQASANQTRFYYYKTPRSSLDAFVHAVPATDAARFSTLRDAFSKVDCTGNRLRTEPIEEKRHPGAQNLICTWASTSPDSILVVAHYTHQGKGASALDDWSGAALLPALCFALQAQPRHNTWIFVESTGARGDAVFLKSLSRAEKSHIRAVIALDALGLDPTLRFFTPADNADPSLADVHLQIEILAASLIDRTVRQPQLISPAHWLVTDDTRPFRYDRIPVVLLHSVPPDKSGWPGSKKDLPSAIDTNAYYDNYRAITIFLVALDRDAAMLNVADDKFWNSGPGGRLNLNDLPYIH